MAAVESTVLRRSLSNLTSFSLKNNNLSTLNFLSPLFKLGAINRKFSQVQLKGDEAVQSVEDVGLNIPAERPICAPSSSDMPLMVPTQAVNKAFQVHQSPRFYTFKPREKMIWLTKTCLTEVMPKEVEDIHDCSADILEACKDIVHQIAAFQRNPRKPSTTFHEEEFTLGLMQDLIRVFTCSNSAAGLAGDLFLQRKPDTEMNWFRNYNFYHAKYQPSIILRSKQPLPKLDVDFPVHLDELPNSMPGPFDTYALGAYEASIIKLKNSIGVKEDILFSKPHVHTIIQVNTRMREKEFFQSCGLMTSFTQLLASSIQQGHLSGLPLKEPINCNCIVTNGTSMMLMVYQLNTTEMLDDRGMWNRAWCSPLMPLYTPNKGYPTKRQFHEIANIDKLENFNPEVFRLFHKLLSR